MVRSSVSLKPTMLLNWGSVVKLEPMLNPLVVVQRDGRHSVMNIRFSACSLRWWRLYHVEEEAEESLAVGGLLMGLGAVGGEYGVGKVVVLIDNEVEVEL